MSATKRALARGQDPSAVSDRATANRPQDGRMFWYSRTCCLCGELNRMRWDHEQVVVERLVTALHATEAALDEAEARLPGLGSAGGAVERPPSVSCPHCYRQV